jgi:hypothetical protein
VPLGTPIDSIRIYVGGFAGPKTAAKKLARELGVYMREKGYSSREIVSRRFNLIPSYYEYVIQFARE